MLNRTLIPVVACTVALGLSACNTVAVRTDYAKDMSASVCHTYAFAYEHVVNAGGEQEAYGNPLNAERLRVSIQSNMAAKGIQLVDRAQADCVVGYAMGSRQVFDTYYGGYYGAGWGFGGGFGRGFGRGYYGFGGGYGFDGPWVENETRIAVDLFDAKSHKPIWHASASQNVYDLAGPQAVQKIDLATAAIFAKFPIAGVAGVNKTG
ncbi:MAG TPA: DUF4136 domain-containing protein [Steroidobacteraceae bacterium]|nr:DUF4136 domain-containing protein [Steroidobacteraceae bacterium]